MRRMLADLGNSRLKWGWVDSKGMMTKVVSLPASDESAWSEAWDPTASGLPWSIASVNPPELERLLRFLGVRGVGSIHLYRSAADVPVAHRLRYPDRTGVDRALAVWEAIRRNPGKPGIVISCGTAITIERVGLDSVWEGGAIGLGLDLSARSLHQQTAQLPLVKIHEVPEAWGDASDPAIRAGVFWGVVGAIREIAKRQAEGLGSKPWLIFTGGDAELICSSIDWLGEVQVVDHLVLHGLAGITSAGTSAH